MKKFTADGEDSARKDDVELKSFCRYIDAGNPSRLSILGMLLEEC